MRVSEDAANLKLHFAALMAKKERARVPEAHLRWLSHLIQLHALAESTPEICRCLTYEELQGLAMIRNVLRETAKNARTCPQCRMPSTSLYDCEHCGARLR